MSGHQILGICRDCGELEIYEDGRYYCTADCQTSGPVHGEVAGPEQAS